MSSSLISQKIQEARLLLAQSEEEQTEGAVIAQKIAELQRESERLLRSAREKRVIGNSQLDASQALANEYAEREEAEVAARGGVVAAAPAKKRGGRPPKAAPVVATSAPLPVAPAAAVAGKRGPKKGNKAEAGAPVAKEANAKPGKKDGKAKEPRAPKKEAAKAKEPRAPREKRATGEKGPPLHEKIKIVMGSKEMTIDDVIAALKAHDESWVPKSRDLNAYISLVLSTHLTDYFDRVKRGIYKVKKGAPVTTATVSNTKEAAAPAPTGPGLAKTNGKRGAHGPSNGASNGLEELGSNVIESPFAGAEVAV